MLDLHQPKNKAFWVAGHRGAMGHAPENTLSAFETGWRMGADFVECDIHLSKDRRCVVMHDESLERTTNGFGVIRETLASSIRQLDAGSWFSRKFKNERVPLLVDLLAWAKPKLTQAGLPLGIIIEVKNEPLRYARFEEALIKEIKKCGMSNRVIVISFDHGVIKRSKRIAPSIATGLLYRQPLEDVIERARQVKADALFPRKHLVNKILVQKAHQQGLAVATWTVNELPEIEQVIHAGVDVVTSNFPDRAFKIRY